MQVNYKYASPSMCIQKEGQTVLGLSPDLSRQEQVSFSGRLKNPLVFRDAMLMLRQIVISDNRQKKKERTEFYKWLDEEIERRILQHEKFLPGIRERIQNDINGLLGELKDKDKEISNLYKVRWDIQKEIDNQDAWKDFYKLQWKFNDFLFKRDPSLYRALDPVITVHPDQVSFEAFSLDESTYGCLSVAMEEFEMLQEPKLGTTNIDFSSKLATEMERFRTYSNVELSVNPGGFTVESGVMPEYVEKKIDLPETWIKGFNQVSAAASLGGVEFELAPVDLYDICSFIRRHKADKSPRYMKWILEPGKNIKILFQPFGKELELKASYQGKKKREEKVWGSRRWLVIEKIIPLAKSFKVRLMGFGMPQFIIADIGNMKMTIGFTSWSSNDWVKGTAFNIMGGFIGTGNYDNIYSLLKDKRFLSLESINSSLKDSTPARNKAGAGMLIRKGEGYFDPLNDCIRFRQLCNTPIDKELYETTSVELKVQEHIDEGMKNFRLRYTADKEFIASHSYNIPNSKYRDRKYRGTQDYLNEFTNSQTEIVIDQDGQITKVNCDCREFKKGPRNISSPCSHILALYVVTSKFLHLEFQPEREYKIDDILEMLL